MAEVFDTVEEGSVLCMGLQGCEKCDAAIQTEQTEADRLGREVELYDDDGHWLVHPSVDSGRRVNVRFDRDRPAAEWLGPATSLDEERRMTQIFETDDDGVILEDRGVDIINAILRRAYSEADRLGVDIPLIDNVGLWTVHPARPDGVRPKAGFVRAGETVGTSPPTDRPIR